MLCFAFVLALGNQSGSLFLFLSLSLSLFLSPFIAFVVDIILTVIVEYFWDLHCLAVCCVLLLFIVFGICSYVCFTFIY